GAAVPGGRVADLAADLVSYPQVLLNVRVREKADLTTIPSVAAVIGHVEGRVAGQGRLLVRYSGTEPLLRVMLEGRHEPEIRGWAQEIVDVVRRGLGRPANGSTHLLERFASPTKSTRWRRCGTRAPDGRRRCTMPS